ncbi:hypothetical protein SISSUDRAFT_1119259 [Sistotremastrum suecicum HHB10207 ss-3]|uniref:Uncharacterized protein n=1 Tax=Sistotremastrum suecicum HHB10207 ss-3 TaxID=1314776 RepID=A0A166DYF0_9AGAM|nr:hypothetical protein SISSUDRAFT_1119259 [Sistotremastrum suecicum HHB10207 ss-3]
MELDGRNQRAGERNRALVQKTGTGNDQEKVGFRSTLNSAYLEEGIPAALHSCARMYSAGWIKIIFWEETWVNQRKSAKCDNWPDYVIVQLESKIFEYTPKAQRVK